MIWEKLYHQSALLEEYRIHDEHQVLATKFNPLHRSARLTFDHLHRLVFLDGIGSISGKIVIKNEYAMVVGSLTYSKSQKNEGNVELDGRKYRFILTDDNGVTVYNKELPSSSLECISSGGSSDNQLNQTDVCCLAISLCWQLSLPTVSAPTLQYAHA